MKQTKIINKKLIINKKTKKQQKMKKLVLLTSVVLALLALFSSCKKRIGDGPIVTEERHVSDFEVVRSDLSADIEIEKGNEFKVVIDAPEKVLNVLESKVVGNMLVLKIKNRFIISNVGKIKVYITMPQLNGILLSGSGKIITKGEFESAGMNIDVSGSGKIIMESLKANVFDARISGSGNIIIDEGLGEELILKISGSGKYDSANYETKNADITVSGSGESILRVTDYLKVKISGSGDVKYYGNPQIDVKISGSGKLIRM